MRRAARGLTRCPASRGSSFGPYPKITRAARTLFARKGFDATTTQEIAARADIGTGTLFNYAKTKEDLLLLVFREEMDIVVEQAFATIPNKGTLLDQLLHVFDAFVAYHQRDV